MRIGILSDTHGVLASGILEALGSCDALVHAGDVGSHEVLEAMRSVCDRVHAVTGNNDVPTKWEGPLATLRSLPAEVTLPLPGGDLVVVHGHRVLPAKRRHERLRADYPQARAIAYGHSHRRVIDRDERPWVINPGAAGRARTFGGASACLLLAGRRRWTVETVLTG